MEGISDRKHGARKSTRVGHQEHRPSPLRAACSVECFINLFTHFVIDLLEQITRDMAHPLLRLFNFWLDKLSASIC